MYRKKVCENWVISLGKPKPKDVNDSLNSVEINNTQQNDHLFKKPLPKLSRKRKSKPQIKSPTPVSTQIYQPSQNDKAFNNSSLMRASRKLVLSRKAKDKQSTKKRIGSQLNTMNQPRKNDIWQTKNSFENLDVLPIQSAKSPNLHISFGNMDESIGKTRTPLEPPIPIPHSENKPNKSNVQIYRSRKETLGFKFHKIERATNFNMNFSSSIAVRTMHDPFTGFLENDVCEPNTLNNLFDNVSSTNNIPFREQQPELNRNCGSSGYSQTSQFHYRHRDNNSIQEHYHQHTYSNYGNNSLTSSDRIDIHSRVSKSRRPKSIRSSSQTIVAPRTPSSSVVAPSTLTSSIGNLNDGVRQSGWPVTININFGQLTEARRR